MHACPRAHALPPSAFSSVLRHEIYNDVSQRGGCRHSAATRPPSLGAVQVDDGCCGHVRGDRLVGRGDVAAAARSPRLGGRVHDELEQLRRGRALRVHHQSRPQRHAGSLRPARHSRRRRTFPSSSRNFCSVAPDMSLSCHSWSLVRPTSLLRTGTTCFCRFWTRTRRAGRRPTRT